MKGKKLACALLVAMLILGVAMVSMGADPQPKLFVDPPTYTATLLGEVFTIDINITNAHNLAGFEFKLGYNTTLLDALDAVEGSLPPKPLISRIIEIHEPEGYVWVLIMCSPVEGNGTLATITFNATYAKSASCTLHLYDTELVDYKGAIITHDVEDGNYEFVILGITVATDKPSYLLGENVEIHGNLTLDASPCQGLVALEIDDPNNHPIVARTLQTGSTSPPGDITIVEVVPCDSWGTPKESFKRGATSIGDLFYVKVTVKNNDPTEGKNVTIIANTYDNNTVPLGIGPAKISPLGPNATYSVVRPIWIPEWASPGNGTVYANVFTDWIGPGPGGDRPQNGTPYCPEKSATFQITGSGGGGAGAPETQGSGNNSTAGNYSLTFKLPVYDVKAGNYTVYASSGYRGQQAINSTTFEAKLVGDVNGDGRVSVADMVKVAIALGAKPGEPNWNVYADVNGDGRISVADMVIVTINLGAGG